MITKSIFTIITGIALLLTSCGQGTSNANPDGKKAEVQTYTNEEIGWTIEIPEGWTVIDQEQTNETNQKGYKALTETIDGEMDVSGLKTLIALQKDPFNIFQSSSEPFEPEYEGEWEQNNAAVKQLIYNTFLNRGIKVDSSVTTTEKIDGLEFQKFSFTIYGPEGDIILNQMMFSRLVNGFDFGVNINYNNDSDRDELLAIFRNSKFEQ